MKAIGISLREEILLGIAFVVLNILDAQLTGTALALGSTEFNPITAGFGSSMLLKGLIATAIAVALVLFGRGRLFKPLNLAMLLIVLWNGFAVWTWM